jgi:SAM-dependent methyltransferase
MADVVHRPPLIETPPSPNPELLPLMRLFDPIEWKGTYFKPKVVLPCLRLERGDSFLDVGCGFGESVVYAAKWGVDGVDGVKMAYGVDIDYHFIENALRLARIATVDGELKAKLDRVRDNLEEWSTTEHILKSMGGRVPPSAGYLGNAMFGVMNPAALALAPDSIDKAQNLSVISYMDTELKRRNDAKELLRVVGEGGLVHISSYEYEPVDLGGLFHFRRRRHLRMIDAGEEFTDVAGRLGVSISKLEDSPTRQGGGVYRVDGKSRPIDPGIFRG